MAHNWEGEKIEIISEWWIRTYISVWHCPVRACFPSMRSMEQDEMYSTWILITDRTIPSNPFSCERPQFAQSPKHRGNRASTEMTVSMGDLCTSKFGLIHSQTFNWPKVKWPARRGLGLEMHLWFKNLRACANSTWCVWLHPSACSVVTASKARWINHGRTCGLTASFFMPSQPGSMNEKFLR